MEDHKALRTNKPGITHRQNMIISRYLDAVGDGSGSKEFNGDYSSAQGIARIKPASGQTFIIHRMVACIGDTAGMSASEYGNLGAALTNGVQVKIAGDAGVVADLTDGLPVKTNAGWGGLCYDVELKTWSSGPEVLLVRWTFEKSGTALTLRGGNGDELQVLLDDNLAGLTDHRFLVQGYFGEEYF